MGDSVIPLMLPMLPVVNPYPGEEGRYLWYPTIDITDVKYKEK